MPDSKTTIWFFSATELSDLSPIMSDLFESDNFDRDYKNVWEWIEGYSNKYKATINISREHNRKQGCYDKPIILRIDFDASVENPSSSMEIIAKNLFSRFSKKIYFGLLIISKEGDYQFLESGKYNG